MRCPLPLVVTLATGCAATGVDRSPWSVTDEDGALVVRAEGREVLRFQHAPVAPPEGVEGLYTRSGYLHPLRTPSGRVVTGDFPASHRHQHGVFTAWTETRRGGRDVDFWNAAEGTGRVECAGVDGFGADADGAWFRARLAHVDLTAPGGPEVAIEERWEVRVARVGRSTGGSATVVDLASTQVARGVPLELLEYRYGGLAVRAPESWEGVAGARAVTSAGHHREVADGSRPRWCALYGPPGPRAATVALLDHPSNFRSPQPVRVHPSNPYFCLSPCRLGPFTLEPGEPYVTRVRIVAHDGEPDLRLLDGLSRAAVRLDAPRAVPNPAALSDGEGVFVDDRD